VSRVPLSQAVFDGVLPNPRGYEERQRELIARRGGNFITQQEADWQRVAADVMFDLAEEGAVPLSETGNPWDEVADDVMTRDAMRTLQQSQEERARIQRDAGAAMADPTADLAGAAAVLTDRAARQSQKMLEAERELASIQREPIMSIRRAVEMNAHGALPSEVTAELESGGWLEDRSFDASLLGKIDTEIEILKEQGEFNRAMLLQTAKINLMRTGKVERDVNVTPTDVYMNEMLSQNAEDAPAYEHFSVGAANAFTATTRALARMIGVASIPDRDRDILEQMTAASMAEAPLTTMGGMFAGGIADPVFFGLGELASGLRVGKKARDAWAARQIARGMSEREAAKMAANLSVRDVVMDRTARHFTKMGMSENTSRMAARVATTAMEGALANAAAEGITEGAYTDQPWAIARRMAEGALVGAVAGPVLDLVVQGVSVTGRAARSARQRQMDARRQRLQQADAEAQQRVTETLEQGEGGPETPPEPAEPQGPPEPRQSLAQRQLVKQIEQRYAEIDDEQLVQVAAELRTRLNAGEQIEGGEELYAALETVYRNRTGGDLVAPLEEPDAGDLPAVGPDEPETPAEPPRQEVNDTATEPETPSAPAPEDVAGGAEIAERGRRVAEERPERVEPDDIVAYMARQTDEPARAGMSPEELRADMEAEAELHRGNLQMLEGAGEPFVKVSIPTTELGYTGNIMGNPAERAIAERYAKMPAETSPPIVAGFSTDPEIVPGQLLTVDGKHRLVAAELRGDRNVEVYVPESAAKRLQGRDAPETPAEPETPPPAREEPPREPDEPIDDAPEPLTDDEFQRYYAEINDKGRKRGINQIREDAIDPKYPDAGVQRPYYASDFRVGDRETAESVRANFRKIVELADRLKLKVNRNDERAFEQAIDVLMVDRELPGGGRARFFEDVPEKDIQRIIDKAERIEREAARMGKTTKKAKTAGKRPTPRVLPAKPDPKAWAKKASRIVHKKTRATEAIKGAGPYVGTHRDGTHEVITDGIMAVRRPSDASPGSIGPNGETGITGEDRRKTIIGSVRPAQKVVAVHETTDLEGLARMVDRASTFTDDGEGVILGATPDGRFGAIGGGFKGVAELGSAGEAGFVPLTVIDAAEFNKMLGAMKLNGEEFVAIHFGDVTDTAPYRRQVYAQGRTAGSEGVIMPKQGDNIDALIELYRQQAADPPTLTARGPGIAYRTDDGPSGGVDASPIRKEGAPGGPERPRRDASPAPSLENDLEPARWGPLYDSADDTPVTLHRRKTESEIKAEDRAMRRARRDAKDIAPKDSPHALITDLFTDVGVAAPRVGGFRTLGKQAAGFYRAWSEGVRLWKKDSVGTAIHELGHAMHKIMFPQTTTLKDPRRGLSPKVFPTSWRKELVQLGRNLYGDRKPNSGYASEGWAELWRGIVADPAYIKREAPTVYREATAFMMKEHPSTWAALMKARGRLRALRDDLRPVGQYIDRARGKAPTLLANVYDDMRTILFDRLERVVRLKRDAGWMDVDPAKDPEIAMRRAFGTARGHHELVLGHGAFDPSDPTKLVGPSIKGILEPIYREGKLDLFEEYLVAKRAVEKRGQGFTLTLGEMSDSRLARFIDDIETNEPALKQAAEDFQGLNEWLVREYAVAHGLIDAETAELIIDKNLHYVTFRHVKGEDAMAPAKRGRGKAGFGGQKAGLGRFREGKGEQLFPPLETFMVNMGDVMRRAQLNRAGVLLTDLVNETPGMARWIERIERPTEAIKVRAEDIQDRFKRALGIRETAAGAQLPAWMADLDETAFQNIMLAIDGMGDGVFFKPGMRVDKELGQFTVLRDGRPDFYEVADRRLLEVIDGLNNMPTVTWVHRLMHIPAVTLKLGTTQLSPEFFIPNGLRDLFQALVMSKRSMGDLPSDVRARLRGVRAAFVDGGFGDLLRVFGVRASDADTQETIRGALAGGAFFSGEFDEYLDRATGAVNFDEMFRPRSMLRRFYSGDVRGGTRDLLTLGPVRRLNNAMEMANRLAEFEAVRQGSARPTGRAAIAEAGQAAADITLDWTRGGTLSRELNYIAAFFNAAMLGTDKLARFIRRNPGKAAGTIMAYVVTPSLIQWVLNRDNPDYWNKDFKERDRHWMFPIPGSENSQGQPRYLQIPKPYGLGLFGILVERNLARLDGIDPVTGRRGDTRAYKNLADTITDELLPSLNIMGVQPLLEAQANYSFFFNDPIVKPWEQDLPYSDQGRERSSQVGRIIGELADVSPAKVDHVITGLTGGLGRTGLQLSDPLLRPLTGAEADEQRPLRVDDYFLVRRFLEGPAKSGAEVLTRFFDEYERVERRVRGLRARSEQPERQREYLERYRPEIARYETLQPYRQSMSDLYARLRAFYSDDSLDGDELNRRVDETFTEMFELARRGLLLSRPTEE